MTVRPAAYSADFAAAELIRRTDTRGAGAAARSAAAPGTGSPRLVTTGGKSGEAAIVDWLNFTFRHEIDVDELAERLSALIGGRPVVWEPMSGGRFGFEHGVRLLAYANCCMVRFGEFSWGGESQRGRALVSISGGGCRLVDDWVEFAGWLEGLPDVRLTRVDLAVDLLEGQFTVDQASTWALEGRFNNGGRNPQLDTQGDWLTGEHGRTLYVGKAVNGKMLRVYEKGKQLGDLESPWVRFEVQFGCRDRVLPIAILVNRDRYFAGAYPALAEVLDSCAERIATIRETTRTTVQKAVEHLRRSYGKWVHLLTSTGIESADLVEAVRVRAVPTRFDAASLADAGLAAAVLAAFKQRGRPYEIHDAGNR